jgi:hypothetical protein
MKKDDADVLEAIVTAIVALILAVIAIFVRQRRQRNAGP